MRHAGGAVHTGKRVKAREASRAIELEDRAAIRSTPVSGRSAERAVPSDDEGLQRALLRVSRGDAGIRIRGESLRAEPARTRMAAAPVRVRAVTAHDRSEARLRRATSRR